MNRVFKGAAIGALISILCWLIPIVHFVSGPLGPFFGGLVAGSTAKSSALQSLGVAAILALIIGVAIGTLIATVVTVLASVGIMFPFGGGQDVALLFGGVLAAHAFLLGSLGAIVGGGMARKSAGDAQTEKPTTESGARPQAQ